MKLLMHLFGPVCVRQKVHSHLLTSTGRVFSFFIFITLLLNSTLSNAQVVSATGAGMAATYPSLQAAITQLNAIGALTTPITISLNPGNPQTAPVGGYIISAQGTVLNTITISGSNNTITAGLQAGGSRNDAIFKIQGGDFVTLQNFTLTENSGNNNFTVASNTMTEWGIALLYANATNGAKNNTIQNNTISLNRSFTNSCGIYSSVRHLPTGSPLTPNDITNITGSNSNNKVYGNSISNVNLPIIFVGSGTDNRMDDGNEIGGSTPATGNTATNWGNNAGNTVATNVPGTILGIFCTSQKGLKVNYNTLTSANLATVNSLRCIYIDFINAPTGTFTHDITYNTVTLVNSSASVYEVIRTQGNTGLATSTININNNTLLNCSSAGEFYGIVNASAPGTLNINNNIFNGCSTSGPTQGVFGLRNTGNVITTININNNQLGNSSGNFFTYTTGNSGLLTGISNIAGSGTTNLSISGNNFQGIINSNGSGGNTFIINTNATASQNISDNTFNNLSISNSGSLTFISNNVSVPNGGTQTVSNNSIIGTFSKAT
ncbi:MAG: hypothetical protein IPH84_06820 [Bacteroidales bacterium]|nr:hypothetical protein [Bacteroidales bacterium]